jgi:hypothetical protein
MSNGFTVDEVLARYADIEDLTERSVRIKDEANMLFNGFPFF